MNRRIALSEYNESVHAASPKADPLSVLALGALHLMAVVLGPALLWDSGVVDHSTLLLWAGAEAILGIASICAFVLARRGRISAFLRISRFESFGTTITISSLAWLGGDVASATPSKYVLVIALITVTSISASNSSRITRRRRTSTIQTAVVAFSYSTAFVIHGEYLFATMAIGWCITIISLTHASYRGMVELIELRRASEVIARHDDLTGLLSRTAFFETIDAQALATSPNWHPSNPQPALVLFDLDGFKAINDSFGHAAGDEVLRTIAKRVTLFLPADAAIGRLGGDEFAAVFTASPHDRSRAIAAALSAIADPIKVDDRELYVAASAGWTLVSHGGASAELMAQADAAMYQSKNSETDSSTGFDSELRDELDRALDIRQRFRTALRRDEILFWAQPIVRTSDGAPIAIELLARWPQSDDSTIGPLEFTRVADETGLAVELDRQALEAARKVLVAWQDDTVLKHITVKANISPVHLHNGQLIDSIREQIPAPIRPRLGLEFVESRLIPAAERNHSQLRDLLDMGITLSIDDFGVGYSSLTYLRSLPVSEIKIDRSFVTDVDSDTINQGLVRAIVDIASTLGLPTVAEGIETESEFAAVARLGVSLGQGFYLGHPLPLSQTASALRDLHDMAFTQR